MISLEKIFIKAFELMPNTFTSYDFGTMCIQLGLKKSHKRYAYFLKKHAFQEEGHPMRWYKKNKYKIEDCNFKTDYFSENKLIFDKAFLEMPKSFTSFDFGKACRKHLLPPKQGGHINYSFYLLNVATQCKLKPRTWIKNNIESTLFEETENPTPPPIIVSDNTQAIKNAIQLLKANNYKVLKPVTEFKEL